MSYQKKGQKKGQKKAPKLTEPIKAEFTSQDLAAFDLILRDAMQVKLPDCRDQEVQKALIRELHCAGPKTVGTGFWLALISVCRQARFATLGGKCIEIAKFLKVCFLGFEIAAEIVESLGQAAPQFLKIALGFIPKDVETSRVRIPPHAPSGFYKYDRYGYSIEEEVCLDDGSVIMKPVVQRVGETDIRALLKRFIGLMRMMHELFKEQSWKVRSTSPMFEKMQELGLVLGCSIHLAGEIEQHEVDGKPVYVEPLVTKFKGLMEEASKEAEAQERQAMTEKREKFVETFIQQGQEREEGSSPSEDDVSLPPVQGPRIQLSDRQWGAPVAAPSTSLSATVVVTDVQLEKKPKRAQELTPHEAALLQKFAARFTSQVSME